MAGDDNSKKEAHKQPLLRRLGPSVVFCSGLILLFVHSFSPEIITVDYRSILLLILLVVIPFMSDVKELILTPQEGLRVTKTTSDLREQVEFSKQNAVEKLQTRLEELETGEDPPEVENEINSRVSQVRSEIREISRKQSPELAFSELSRKIESELRDILREEGIEEAENISLMGLINLARESEVLDESLIINLENIRPLRNQVVHGEDVESSQVEEMIEVGISILETMLYDIQTSDITEHTIQEKILQDPDLVEEGFEPTKIENHTEYGRIDILGKDSDGNPVIVELKSHRAKLKHVEQLTRLVENNKQKLGENIRGILVAPSIGEKVSIPNNDRISFKKIDLNKIKDPAHDHE